MNIDLRLGDCIEVLKTIPDNSIDSIVTDPPYGIGFMGKAWDTFEPDNVKKAVETNTESFKKNIETKQDNPNLKGRKNAPIGSSSTFAGTYDLSNKGKNDYQQWCYEWGKECFRVLKPGGHLLASNSPRMYHRMAIGLEDAGFEIRDQIMWVYGSGFPKSLNIGKAIDKRKEWDKYEIFSNSLKSKREKMGLSKKQAFDKCGFQAETFGGNSWYEDGRIPSSKDYELLKSGLELGDEFDGLFEEVEREFIANDGSWGKEGITKITGYGEWKVTKGNSEWEGWGTALKPAHEPIVMARKPLSEKSIAENVLKHGTGGLNIDGSRIEFISDKDRQSSVPGGKVSYASGSFAQQQGLEKQLQPKRNPNDLGRFPANIIFDEEAGKLLDEQSGISKSTASKGHYRKGNTVGDERTSKGAGLYGDGNWIEGSKHNDSGGASRFFYCPKTSKKDRNEGLDNFEDKVGDIDKQAKRRLKCADCDNWYVSGNKEKECKCLKPNWIEPKTKNNHPTVKPTDLMRYLINLVTPKGGTTLDPFMGSGSTGKAAVRCGVNFIGIEKEKEYMDIARARIEHEKNKPVQQKLL